MPKALLDLSNFKIDVESLQQNSPWYTCCIVEAISLLMQLLPCCELLPKLVGSVSIRPTPSAHFVETADQVAPGYHCRRLMLALHISEDLDSSLQVLSLNQMPILTYESTPCQEGVTVDEPKYPQETSFSKEPLLLLKSWCSLQRRQERMQIRKCKHLNGVLK